MTPAMAASAPSLLSKHYAPAILSRLSRFPSRDQLPIASWLIHNPIGTNYAMQILGHLEDLARKEEHSPAHLLTQVLAPLKTDKLQPKDLGRQVRDQLAKKLHPASEGHREAFEAWTRTLKVGSSVRIHPPQNFEGTQYKLEVAFEDPQELRKSLARVLQSLDEDFWEKLKEF